MEMTFPHRNNKLFTLDTDLCRYVKQLVGAVTLWENDFMTSSHFMELEKKAVFQHLNVCNEDIAVYLQSSLFRLCSF